MESIIVALRSKEGRIHLIIMAAGIVLACLGGYLLSDSGIFCDIVVIVGSGISMIAVDQFCRLIIRLRDGGGQE